MLWRTHHAPKSLHQQAQPLTLLQCHWVAKDSGWSACCCWRLKQQQRPQKAPRQLPACCSGWLLHPGLLAGLL